MIVNYYSEFLSYSDLSIGIPQKHHLTLTEGSKADIWQYWMDVEGF